MSAFPGSQVPARREAGQELRPKPLSNFQTLQPDRMDRDQREGNGSPAHSKIYVRKIKGYTKVKGNKKFKTLRNWSSNAPLFLRVNNWVGFGTQFGLGTEE